MIWFRKIAGLTQTITKKSDFPVGAIHVALADRRVFPLPKKHSFQLLFNLAKN